MREDQIELAIEIHDWIENAEVPEPPSELIQRFFEEVKEECLEELEEVRLNEEDLKDLVKILLRERWKRTNKKKTWDFVNLYFKGKHWSWKFLEDRETIFEIAYSWIPRFARGRPRKRLPEEEIEKLRKEGLSLRRISERIGVGKSTIQRFLSSKT